MDTPPTVQQAIDAFKAGRLDEGQQVCRAILRVRHNDADALHLMGFGSAMKGQPAQAAEWFRRAIAAKPGVGVFHMNLGNAYQDQGLLPEALAEYRRAKELTPGEVQVNNGMGSTLQKMERFEEAEGLFREAIGAAGGDSLGHYNLGTLLHRMGRYAEARGSLNRAVELSPDWSNAQWNLALIELLMGDYLAGWKRLEWRWRCAGYKIPRWSRPQPLWDGSALGGRRILLHMEQGYGDDIQMIRYVDMIQERGGRVLIATLEPLLRLFQSMTNAEAVFNEADPYPAFEVHAPLMSLPRIFGTTVESVPAKVPYLYPQPEAARRWGEKLGKEGLTVGICWAGKPSHLDDHNRSMPLATLAPLWDIPGVRFVRLQMGPTAFPINDAFPMLDFTAELRDFADTAALMANLDLVISVDTAIAHLAGALGRPTWTLLPYVADWRWMAGREDSPWYPTMRLFRQPAKRDWGSVVQRLHQDLAQLAGSRGGSGIGDKVSLA